MNPKFQLFITTLIVVLFIHLFAPALLWMGRQLSSPQNSFHIVAAILFMVLGVKALWQQRDAWSARLWLVPVVKWHGLSLAVFTLGCLGFVANEYFTGINVFSAVMLVVAGYGLLGMTAGDRVRRNALVPCLLLVLLLPFEDYLDFFLGFPLRLLSADLAGDLLSVLGITHLTNESIIVIENKAALVDLDCSGLKGLWAGLIFYVLLTWVEQKRVSARWIIGLPLFMGCLLCCNALRIAILVLLDLVWGRAAVAAGAHETLGILGFLFSCVFAWWLMQWQREPVRAMRDDAYTPEPAMAHRLTQALLIVILLGTNVLYTPLTPVTKSGDVSSLTPPPEFQGQKVRLSSAEEQLFKQTAASAVKYDFDWQGYGGSVVFVQSAYWKGQHDPRLCYQGQGVSIDYEEIRVLANQEAVKYLAFNNGERSAVYWFQSPSRKTADYTARLFYGWLTPQEPWVMVSLLWDGPVDAETAERLILKLQRQVNIFW